MSQNSNDINPKIEIDFTAIGPSFSIKDYLESATDASTRTRTVTIVLVIASILIFIGFWNSFKSSWATERLRAAYNTAYESKYNMLADDNHNIESIDKEGYQKNLQEEVIRAYIDNVRFIKIPFLGIAIEINDLATIGGVSFIIILVLLRFSLSREIKNLNMSFKEAVHHKQLCEFYHALAMRQVLTVPEMTGEERNILLSHASKVAYILPVFVLGVGVAYDFSSTVLLDIYKPLDVIYTHIFETAFFALVVFLSYRCYERQRHIDEIWRSYWNQIDKESSSIIRIDKKIAESLGSEKNIIRTLRKASRLNQVKIGYAQKDVSQNKKENRKSYIIQLNKNLTENFGSDKRANEILKNYLKLNIERQKRKENKKPKQ